MLLTGRSPSFFGASLQFWRVGPAFHQKMFSWLSSPTDVSSDQAVSIGDSPIVERKRAENAQAFYQQGDPTRAPPSRKRGSAAAYYGSTAAEVAPLPGADELNAFLNLQQERARGEGIVTVVLGNEAADLDSIVSAVAFAYLHFHLAQERQVESSAYLPVINIPRADLKLRTDCLWLLTQCGVDINALTFADDIDLAALNSNNRLRLILVDHNRLPPPLAALGSCIVEIIDHHKAEGLYPRVTASCIQPVGSCSTLVADRISQESGELLANRVLCRLLLAAILVDTADFDPQLGRTLPLDQTMGALLAVGAGEQGATAFARTLQEKKADQSHFSTEELLRRDYKQWAMGPGSSGEKGEVIHVGVASMGLPLSQVVGKDPNFLQALRSFSSHHHLHLLVLMTLYTSPLPPNNKFKRELALFSDLDSLSTGLAYHLQSNEAGLQLRPMTVKGVSEKVKTFSQGQVAASRKQVQPLLVDYFLGGK